MSTAIQDLKEAGIDPSVYVPLFNDPVTISYQNRARSLCDYSDSLFVFYNKKTGTCGWGYFEKINGDYILKVPLHNFCSTRAGDDNAIPMSPEEMKLRLLPAGDMAKRYATNLANRQRERAEQLKADAESRKDFGNFNLRKANPKFHEIGQAILSGRMPWTNPDTLQSRSL